jgi:hypothetical protein
LDWSWIANGGPWPWFNELTESLANTSCPTPWFWWFWGFAFVAIICQFLKCGRSCYRRGRFGEDGSKVELSDWLPNAGLRACNQNVNRDFLYSLL